MEVIKMFVDEIKVKLIAGDGGDGCMSFHHEKCMPNLGPDGGNGGKGADIIFVAEKGLRTLVDLRYNKIVKAPKGENGKGSDRTGSKAENVIIKVPLGTLVYDAETNNVLADLVHDGEEFIAAKGGRGGRGNKAFATHDNPAPKVSENGEPGTTILVRLELRVLADVGLVGLPSVGKSTILSLISSSKPKIAAYHFTTLNPNLGVVKLKDHRTFVMADLPGLIEGAAEGNGLGLKFLRHAMRTKVIAHVVDMGSFEGRNPIEDFEIINKELTKYSIELANKPQVVIANKMDLPNAQSNLAIFKKQYPHLAIIEISALNNQGIDDMITKIADILYSIPEEDTSADYSSNIVYKYHNELPFKVIKHNDAWEIIGPEIDKLFAMTKFTEDESVLRFARKLKGMGVEAELERLGAKRGDDVIIDDYVFQFKD